MGAKALIQKKLTVTLHTLPEKLYLQDFDSHSCQQLPKLSNSDLPLSFKPNQPLPEIPTNPHDSLSPSPPPTSLSSLACLHYVVTFFIWFPLHPFCNICWSFLFSTASGTSPYYSIITLELGQTKLSVERMFLPSIQF